MARLLAGTEAAGLPGLAKPIRVAATALDRPNSIARVSRRSLLAADRRDRSGVLIPRPRSSRMPRHYGWAVLALAALLPTPARAQTPYRDPALPVEARARD